MSAAKEIDMSNSEVINREALSRREMRLRMSAGFGMVGLGGLLGGEKKDKK